MSIGLQFSYVISDDVTIDMSVFGGGLVLSEDSTFTAGTLERVSFTLNYSTEIESYGVQDRTMISIIFDDTPVTSMGEDGVTADMLYFTGVGFYAQAIQQLGRNDNVGTVLVDDVSTARLEGTTAQDHVTVGGTGRTVSLSDGADIARAQADAGGMEFLMGRGHDSAYGGAGDDLLNGGKGDDLLVGGGGDDTLLGGRGDDTLHDFEGDNILRGGAGDDVILGGSGRDTLRGDAGNDVLVGNGGSNRMVGGADADAFVLLFGGTEQLDTWHGAIMDFEQGVDKLWMSATGNSTYDAGDAYAQFAEHAQQRGDNVVLRDGDWRLVIRDADLDDFSVDDFIDGAQGVGFYQWADSLG